MKKRKICCFCEKWESGGIESFLWNAFSHMDLQNFEIDILVAKQSNSIFTQPLQDLGLHFIELSGKQHSLAKNHQAFVQLLALNHYDVVYINAFHGLTFFYAWLAKRQGVPVRIIHGHNTTLRKSRTRPLKLLIHRCTRSLFSGCATQLWACSEHAADFMFSKRTQKKLGVQVIPNGIELARFRFDPNCRTAVRKQLDMEDCVIIGNVGRLCFQKKQDFLLDVFAQVHAKRPDSRLLLVGEGEERLVLQQKVKQLGLEPFVLFCGVSSQVEKLLWAMDVFVFPSRFEGLGIAAIEAQAAGLPVLCSDCLPKETHVTKQIKALSLNASVQTWADEILKLCDFPRQCGDLHQIRRAGFDINMVAKQLEQHLMG